MVFAESKSIAQYNSLREYWATVTLDRKGRKVKPGTAPAQKPYANAIGIGVVRGTEVARKKDWKVGAPVVFALGGFILYHIAQLRSAFFLSEAVAKNYSIGYTFSEMDSISSEKRSWVMSRVKGRDTRPEKVVRSLLHRMGYRFRLQRKDLPGKPDIVLPKYHAVIFVHGCYWHRHDCSNGRRVPKSRLDYWLPKLEGNRERDTNNQALLKEHGWFVLVIWECMLRNEDSLKKIIRDFLTVYRYNDSI